jgi:ubiquitin-protein ligase
MSKRKESIANHLKEIEQLPEINTLSYTDKIAIIEFDPIQFLIEFPDNYPYTPPKVKITKSSSKKIDLGYIPNQFEMETLDRQWKFHLKDVIVELTNALKVLK